MATDALLIRQVRDRATGTLLTAAILVAVMGLALGIYAGFDDQIVSLFSNMPEAMRALYGSNDGTVAGLSLGAMFSIVAPLVVLIYAISAGVWAAVGEERHRSLELLLMNPVSRARVATTKLTVAAAGALLICAALWLGVVGIAALVGMSIVNLDVLAVCVHLAGLALAFGALAAAISAWTGTGIGAGIAGVVAAVSYLVTTLLPVDPSLADLARWTPWYLYSGPEPLLSGVGWWSVIGLLAAGLVLGAAAVVGLGRRDLRG